jgi:hypothetical protein
MNQFEGDPCQPSDIVRKMEGKSTRAARETCVLLTVTRSVPAMIFSFLDMGPIFARFSFANLGASGLLFTVGG